MRVARQPSQPSMHPCSLVFMRLIGGSFRGCIVGWLSHLCWVKPNPYWYHQYCLVLSSQELQLLLRQSPLWSCTLTRSYRCAPSARGSACTRLSPRTWQLVLCMLCPFSARRSFSRLCRPCAWKPSSLPILSSHWIALQLHFRLSLDLLRQYPHKLPDRFPCFLGKSIRLAFTYSWAFLYDHASMVLRQGISYCKCSWFAGPTEVPAHLQLVRHVLDEPLHVLVLVRTSHRSSRPDDRVRTRFLVFLDH